MKLRPARPVVVALAVGGVALLVLVVVLGVHSFQSEKRQPNTVYGAEFCMVERTSDCVDGVDGAMVYADVLAVEPENHSMTVRLDVLLPALYFDNAGLTTGLILDVSGRDVATFEPGSEQIHTLDVEVELAKLPHECCADVVDPNTSNRVTSYPFDRYDADWFVTLRTQPDGDNAPTVVPLRVSLKHAVHGYRIEAERDLADSYVLRIERSGSTVVFAVFVLVIMWGLTIGIVAMAIILTAARRDIGPGLLGFLAAMLFAFPGIRSVLPGAPPLGSLFDYLAFFWCEGIIGITLLVLTTMYLKRELDSYRSEPRPAKRTK